MYEVNKEVQKMEEVEIEESKMEEDGKEDEM